MGQSVRVQFASGPKEMRLEGRSEAPGMVGKKGRRGGGWEKGGGGPRGEEEEWWWLRREKVREEAGGWSLEWYK